MAVAAGQFGLLNVPQHLLEDSLGTWLVGCIGQSGSETLDNAANLGETEAARRNAAVLRRQNDHGADQIVGGDPHIDLFGHHVRRQASELIQTQSAFQRAKVRLSGKGLARC